MVLRKFLMVDVEKCTSCRLCELACSTIHYKAFNPSRALVKVYRSPEKGVDVPVVCRQCGTCACVEACPTDAFVRDGETGSMRIDRSLCIDCRECVTVCPFGAVSVDPVEGTVQVCDLCGGDPECVKYCVTKALTFISPGRAGEERRGEIAEAMASRVKWSEYKLPE